jgi:hypothetical protein
MDLTAFNITEMIPATGWRAVFKVNTGFFTEPLACWGRGEDLADDGHMMIVGFVADGPELRPAPENALFHSYCTEAEVGHYLEDLRETRL